jgi:long-chain fatty acid transport protein
MRLFPETSVLADLNSSGVAGDMPGESFFGMDVVDMSGLGLGLRLGAQYTRGALALGGSYFTKTSLDPDGGKMTLNLAALGPGEVTYDAQLADFSWPQQAGLGLAYRVTRQLLIAGDVDWVNWSDAIETVTIKADSPDKPVPPPLQEVQIPFQMNWNDQWVWAIGAEFVPAASWAVRLGYNHGDSPIPSSTLRPLFPAIGEDHLTGGCGFRTGPWIFDLGLEYVLKAEETNNSDDPTLNPFGPGSEETLSQFMAHFMVRFTFPT